jgi:hypothetical protein
MSTLPAVLTASRARAWAWWVVPVVVFAALVGWEIDWGRQVVRLPAAPLPAEPKPVTPALLPDYAIEGGLAANGETVNRTLFTATRRPAPVLAGDGGPRALKPGQFLLVGTTMSGDRNIAFLKEVTGGKSRTVRQGEKINGMLVASVTAERVKLTLGDESEELLLKVAPGPKTTLAAAPPPPPPTGAPPVAPAAAPSAAAAAATPAAAAAVPRQVGGPPANAQEQAERAKAARRARAAQQGAQGTDQGSTTTYAQPQGQGK